jgi:predicted PurR-regulated permease PerM
MARIITLTVLVTLIVILGVTFFQVIAPFLLPLFLAAVVAIISQPLYRFLVRRTGNRPRVAAGLTTAAVILSVLTPLLVGTFIAAVQLFELAHDGDSGWGRRVRALRQELEIDQLAERLLPYIYGVEPSVASPDASESPTPEESAEAEELARARERRIDELNELEKNLSSALQTLSARTMGFAGAAAPSILAALVGGLISALMFVIALYYFLADGPLLLAAAEQLIPVQADYQRELLRKFDTVVRAVVLATFMASVGQGLVTASALAACGFGSLFFVIFIVSMFTSLVPFAGVWVVWGPFAIYFASQGDWGKVLFLVLIGGGVAGTMDNIIKTYVLHTDAKLHPLLAFVCILGGLRAMGLWGVFVGPIVASCLHALVKIFNAELKEFSRSKFGEAVGVGSPPEPPSAVALAGDAPDQQQSGKRVPAAEDPTRSMAATKSASHDASPSP